MVAAFSRPALGPEHFATKMVEDQFAGSLGVGHGVLNLLPGVGMVLEQGLGARQSRLPLRLIA
jgi:hypothetical protein